MNNDTKGFWIITAIVVAMYLYATIPDTKPKPTPTPAYVVVKTSAPNPPIPATKISALIPTHTPAPSSTPRPLPSPSPTAYNMRTVAPFLYDTATPRPIATQRPAPTQAAPKLAPPAPPRGSAQPIGYDCPDTHPIKGNGNSGIYHVPSGAFYHRTNPEECFSTEADALAAGYRRALK